MAERLQWTAGLLAVLGVCGAQGQDLEPRLYTAAPVGLNFLAVAYATSSGGALFDPSVPLENAEIDVDAPALAYVRTLGLWGKSAKVDATLAHACLSGTATLAGEVVSRDVCGLADPRVRLSVNFLGAPALTRQQFAAYKQDLLVGASLQVTAPTGQYDDDRVVNVGTNRWSLRPEIGFSKTLRRLIVEMAASAAFYGDNGDFVKGNKEQDPIYSLQLHVVHVFPKGAWLAGDATHYRGGRSTVAGVTGDDLQSNARFGATFGMPLTPSQSLRLAASTGVSTRTGTDFDTFVVAWQYRWAASQ